MNRLCSLFIGLVCVFGSLAADEPQPPKSMEEMMKQMMEFGAPSEQHQMLEKLAGQWDCEVTEYPMFPGMEITISKGKAKFESEFGGRFVKQEFESEFNGMKYKGIGFMGYDKGKQVFFSTWMDNMSTQFLYAEGSHDEAANTITETCKTHCPLGEMSNKLVTTMKSDDEILFEMYAQLAGQAEMKKMMQILYRRK